MERKRILIATKTYPSISTKYKETVCTAGVLLDDEDKPIEWVRIYPIRFRKLDIDNRYKKWSIISAKIERNEKDKRAESYKIDDTSIEVLKEIGKIDNRKCRDKSQSQTLEDKERDALEKIRQKLEVDFMNKKDLYFIVGNLKSHPQNFMIIGLFYPPLIENQQLKLF